MAPPRRRHHLFVAGLGIGQIVSWGSLIYSFPLLADPMALELGWSRTEAYLLASLALGCAGVTAVPVGAAIDRGYGRAVMGWGSLLTAVLLWLWSQATDGWLLVPLFVAFGLVQSMTLYEPAFAVVARRFGAEARRGITALTLWGGFASTVFVPLTQILLDRFGWRGALEILALFNLAVSLPLHLLVIDVRGDTAGTRPKAMEDRAIVGWAVRQPAFWGLAVAFTVYYAIFSGMSFHLYPLLSERGLPALDIVTAMVVVGPAQVAGRILIAALAHTVSIRRIALAASAMLPATFAVLAAAGASMTALLLFALAYGAANGVMTIVRGAAVPEMLTPSAYGSINGILTVPTALVRASAPTLAALLWQWHGSYGAVVVAAMAASLLVLAAFCFAAGNHPPAPAHSSHG